MEGLGPYPQLEMPYAEVGRGIRIPDVGVAWNSESAGVQFQAEMARHVLGSSQAKSWREEPVIHRPRVVDRLPVLLFTSGLPLVSTSGSRGASNAVLTSVN